MAAADTAYEWAKDRILDGRLAGGELISEGEVAAGVGLSRTPVREAFVRLESEGLLRLYPKRGALVVPVSLSEVEHVLETREVVEQHAVARVIAAGAELAAPAAALVAEQERLASAGDALGFVEADRRFHRLYVEAAGNPILLALHDSLRDRQSRMGLAALGRDAARTQQILAEHRALAAAVDARDAGAARSMVTEHLQGTRRLLRAG